MNVLDLERDEELEQLFLREVQAYLKLPSQMPGDVNSYLQDPRDHNRQSSKDSRYAKKYFDLIKTIFNNACAVCKSSPKTLHRDHFNIIKKEGGAFYMRSSSRIINNLIPLCAQCNQRKGTKRPCEIYQDSLLDEIAVKNELINAIINEDLSLMED